VKTWIVRRTFYWIEAETEEQAISEFEQRISRAFPDNSDADTEDLQIEEWSQD
jgi:hypothetical protein